MMAAVMTQPVSIDLGMIPVVNEMEDMSLTSKLKRKDETMGNGYAKLLDQSKKRLNSLDAQRIIGIVEECIHRCEIVTLLPFIVENIDRYSVMLGVDIVRVLKEYDRMQHFYMKAVSTLRKVRPGSSRSASRNSNTEISEGNGTDTGNLEDITKLPEYHSAIENMNNVSTGMTDIEKIILRLFRSNPVAANTLKSERHGRSYEANSFIDNLKCLREVLYNRLVTTASEEQEKQKISVQILMREKKARVAIEKLEAELDKSENEMKETIDGKNNLIRTLKLTIQAIEQESEIENRKIMNDHKKMETAEGKNSELLQSKLRQDIIMLKQQFQTNTSTHRENELLMRKRKFKIETEVENWIQKYDSDMTEKQDELDELGSLYAEEKSQLEQLEDRFETLEREYKSIVEERRIAAEKKKEEEELLRKHNIAATRLQSFWRAYRSRKVLKAKLKKGKKGKSGKKKKNK